MFTSVSPCSYGPPEPGYNGHWCTETKRIDGSSRDDVLRAVAMMDVPVDDRHPLDAQLSLRPACRNRGRVEQAEAHRPITFGVVARRTRECEPVATHRLDRRPGGEERRLERRVGAECVLVDRPSGRANLFEQPSGVTPQHVGLARWSALVEREAFVQDLDAPLGLRVRARRVQTGEGGVAYDLDERIAPSSSSSDRSPCARPIR